MFSLWTEAFPCRQAAASSVAKVLLENIIPPWGTPVELHSDGGSHFIGLVLRQICVVWSILHTFAKLPTLMLLAYLNTLITSLRLNWQTL